MIVIIRFDIDDLRRRAFAHRMGRKGLATRKELLIECISTLECLFDDHLDDYEKAKEIEEERKR